MVNAQGEQEDREERLRRMMQTYGDALVSLCTGVLVEAEDSYGFAAHLFAEKEVIAEDIPLCSFEAVKPDLAALIEEGYIRELYGIQFGFAAYPDERHDLENYILFPAWVIECEYYDSPELATQAVDVPDYSNSQHYRRLVANAQTGKLLDPRSKGPNRSDAPEIIMWKDTP